MPQADKNLTTSQLADAADAYLAEVRERWDEAENAVYPSALAHLRKALFSLADVPRLLEAVEAALTLADGWIANSAVVPLIDREAAGLGIRAAITEALTREANNDER